MSDEHEITVDERAFAPKFSAACLCGWTGQTRHVRDNASFDGWQHLEHVVAYTVGRAVGRLRPDSTQTPSALRIDAAAGGDGAPVGCLPPDPRPAAPQQTRTQQ